MPLGLLILVAAIQGLTEFLPVSSSGHLVLIPLVTNYAYQGQTIDVAAHVGTLLAVLVYLRTEVLTIVIALIGLGRHDKANALLGMMLVLATIPVIIAGYLLNYASISLLDLTATLAISNLVFAALLWRSDRTPTRHHTIQAVGWQQAITIGLAQVFALIPGTSRSGVTMTAARFLGFDRIVAARFSLLLSLPVIAGAGLLKTRDLLEAGNIAVGMDAVLVLVLSAGMAFAAIRWMMGWLAKAGFGIFVVYRLCLGGGLLLLLLFAQISPTIS